jgi:hypothetical protein
VVYVSNCNVQALDIVTNMLNKADRVIKSRRMRWECHVACMGDSSCAYRILVGRAEKKRPVGRPRRRWEDNIKMYLQEMEWGGGGRVVDWIDVAQYRDRWRELIEAVMNLRVP